MAYIIQLFAVTITRALDCYTYARSSTFSQGCLLVRPRHIDRRMATNLEPSQVFCSGGMPFSEGVFHRPLLYYTGNSTVAAENTFSKDKKKIPGIYFKAYYIQGFPPGRG